MFRGRRGGRRRGPRGGYAKPLVASTPEVYNPQGEEQVVGKEHIVVGDVVGLMRSFQRMSKAWIIYLDRDETRVSTPPKGPPCTLVGTSSIHQEIDKVKFVDFAWLENMAMRF